MYRTHEPPSACRSDIVENLEVEKADSDEHRPTHNCPRARLGRQSNSVRECQRAGVRKEPRLHLVEGSVGRSQSLPKRGLCLEFAYLALYLMPQPLPAMGGSARLTDLPASRASTASVRKVFVTFDSFIGLSSIVPMYWILRSLSRTKTSGVTEAPWA